MVSLTESRNRLQPSFTPDQAELIANLHVEMHDQLVTRHDFTELRGVVEQLAHSQQELVEAQHELAEAQKRTEYAIKDLAKQVGGLAATAGGNLEASWPRPNRLCHFFGREADDGYRRGSRSIAI
jgi:hypothetical protein